MPLNDVSSVIADVVIVVVVVIDGGDIADDANVINVDKQIKDNATPPCRSKTRLSKMRHASLPKAAQHLHEKKCEVPARAASHRTIIIISHCCC